MAIWLTRGTVWLALCLYVASSWASARRGPASISARVFSALGCAAFLAHVAAAFQFHHHWSHAAAEAETARQTAALVGWNWGGGVYLNYLFALVWLSEVIWVYNSPGTYPSRPGWVNWSVRGLFLFMIFNGAVVFVSGPRRWIGLLLCAWLVLSWYTGRTQRLGAASESERSTKS